MNKPFTEKLQYGDSVLIVENAGQAKTSTPKGSAVSDYILRGPAAFFGELNNNGRVYEASDYLPHLSYLQEKIKTRGLMGELDHPKEFETSLNRVSHVVEHLDYDRGTNSINIQVRLCDTPYGNIAKALIESGVTLSISSRAAGSVAENNKVKLKRIFTYDLVADPGFEKAQLNRICESSQYLGEMPTPFEGASIYDGLQLINENLGLESTSTRVYRVPAANESFAKAIGETTEIKNEKTPNMNYVTAEELDGYSKVILKEIAAMKDKMSSTTANESDNERLERLEKYVVYIAEQLDKAIDYSGYLAENLDSVMEYSKYLAENLDNMISYGDYLAEQVDNGIAYGEYIAEQVDNVISYGDYLAEQVDNSIAYGEYLAENIDNSIAYGEYIAEQVDTVISYGDYLGENLRNSITYAEYLAENLDANIAYSEYLAEKTENVIAYSDYLAESIEGIPANEIIVEKEEKKEEIIAVKESASTITSKIDMLIESVSKKKTVAAIEHHFFRFINEAKREEFNKLDETAKEKVVTALKDKAYFNESQVLEKWNKALIETPAKKDPIHIALMPESVKPLYEALTTEQKSDIEGAALLFNLDSQYKVNHFWTTRPQINKDSIGLIKLTESQTTETKKVTAIPSNMESIANQIGKRFKK